ncbi:GntR family transcriptional regulator [Sulfitobacter mediterraneus]|jgi:DNA-binding GntR family transcriptional regulator|uniref:GntR family transcriptional regulator n=1 Tax=Sulfitobacter mediterraneus TaxID=83219 RepID=A0A2T6C873_9RHOB|nr:GntR family transcriptional regulator [Sulfitobacter mediterraneus]KIN78944.1 Transcriptional regulator, GntR family [Sulfitobacter mediterraneus KCTC 32188]PTX64476.1 GntR family transcriptional regulator [Sulfitobacter mediterraneus]UWR13495.1 GntR family transcriptional regulator [Sulfitobacter mediterraneus]
MESQKKKRAAGQTVDRLRELVLGNTFSDGEALRQTEIAELLGVSRTPVREALKELAQEGLVQIGPTGRTVVAGVDLKLIREYYEIRCQLEMWMLRLAIPVMTDAHIQKASEINQKMLTCQPDEWPKLNFEFHKILCGPANKPHTMALIEDLYMGSITRLRSPMRMFRNPDRSVRDHNQILQACRNQDVQGACDRLESHILLNSHALIEHLSALQANS